MRSTVEIASRCVAHAFTRSTGLEPPVLALVRRALPSPRLPRRRRELRNRPFRFRRPHYLGRRDARGRRNGGQRRLVRGRRRAARPRRARHLVGLGRWATCARAIAPECRAAAAAQEAAAAPKAGLVVRGVDVPVRSGRLREPGSRTSAAPCCSAREAARAPVGCDGTLTATPARGRRHGRVPQARANDVRERQDGRSGSGAEEIIGHLG